MRTLFFGCMLVAGVEGQSQITASEQLARIRSQMAENLSQLPNYTCRQTVERWEKIPPSKKFIVRDLLRLDVAYLRNRELFAWPDAAFEANDVRELVPTGQVGLADF